MLSNHSRNKARKKRQDAQINNLDVQEMTDFSEKSASCSSRISKNFDLINGEKLEIIKKELAKDLNKDCIDEEQVNVIRSKQEFGPNYY